MIVTFTVNGDQVSVDDDGASLLDVLRERLGLRSVKDGCSPQGQCGCCTVWVDGAPRVACVTSARRCAGRSVTTLEGLPKLQRETWAEAFTAAGASQCGFCTPGIVMRLAALQRDGDEVLEPTRVRSALLAHLCRCTGWTTIVEAAGAVAGGRLEKAERRRGCGGRDFEAASKRASIEGRTNQAVGPGIAMGGGGFADDTAPAGALVAVPDGSGGWAVGETLQQARRAAGKVQGRRSTSGLEHPVELPEGEWSLTLRTTWVDPAYVETDASWCVPGGEPASSLGNGGAFGGKVESRAGAAAQELAGRHGRAVRTLLSREDAVRSGPKRPPVAAGVRSDGTGRMRVVRTPGIADAVASVAPGIEVEEVDVLGPATSTSLRGAGWVEAAVLLAANARSGGRTASSTSGAPGPVDPVRVGSPWGAWAEASIDANGDLSVRVSCGEVLDETVLRSYCIGASHMALGWVRSEGIALGADGSPCDLSIRSFGVLRAKEMPRVEVTIADDAGPPVNGSDAVFGAVAAAAWLEDGLVDTWPTRSRRQR